MKTPKAKYYSVTANQNSDGSISVVAWHKENRRNVFDMIPIHMDTEREKLNQAAPELLAALQFLLSDHERMFPEAHPNSTISWAECEEVIAAQAAIAKATLS